MGCSSLPRLPNRHRGPIHKLSLERALAPPIALCTIRRRRHYCALQPPPHLLSQQAHAAMQQTGFAHCANPWTASHSKASEVNPLMRVRRLYCSTQLGPDCQRMRAKA